MVPSQGVWCPPGGTVVKYTPRGATLIIGLNVVYISETDILSTHRVFGGRHHRNGDVDIVKRDVLSSYPPADGRGRNPGAAVPGPCQ